MLILIYWFMTMCACGYAALAGGWAGRIGGAIIIVKTAGGAILTYGDPSWHGMSVHLLWLDGLCLAAFAWLCLWSNRLWPLWSAAAQLLAVLIHVATIWAPDATPMAYQALQNLWAIPMQIFMIRGIARDEKSGWSRR